MRPLIESMLHNDPSTRPSAVESFTELKAMLARLGEFRLSKRVALRNQRHPESALVRIVRDGIYRVQEARWKRDTDVVRPPGPIV